MRGPNARRPVALSLLSLAVVSATWPAASATHLGDDWRTYLTAAYTAPDGSLVQLTATWTTWSGWPIPFARPERLENLELFVDVRHNGEYKTHRVQQPSARFSQVAIAGVGGVKEIPIYRAEFAGEAFRWLTDWSWDRAGACSYTALPHELLNKYESPYAPYAAPLAGIGNRVLGELEDRGASFNGEPLKPLATAPGPGGPITVNGFGTGWKTGPGPDRHYECYDDVPGSDRI